VNSYKRINAPRTLSGATWSPNTITYAATTARKWSHPIPAASSCADDGAANPYLIQAGVLAAGSTAPPTTATRQAPGHQHVHGRAYGEERRKLPLNLLDALRTTDRARPARRLR